MIRNILIISFMLCALALSGCNDKTAPAASGPKVATVDVEKVFQGSKLAVRGMDYLDKQSNAMNARLTEMQNEVTAKPEDQELSMRLQVELGTLQQQFEQDRITAAEKINGVFDKVVADYLKANNLDAIFTSQVALAAAPGTDVTDKIIELMDKEEIDFGSVPAQAPAAPAQPEADGATK